MIEQHYPNEVVGHYGVYVTPNFEVFRIHATLYFPCDVMETLHEQGLTLEQALINNQCQTSSSSQ